MLRAEMASYYRFQADLHATSGVLEDPALPDGVSFTSGRALERPLPTPLVFKVDCPKGQRPDHLLGDSIPLVSELFLETLRAAGVENFQAFPARLRNTKKRAEWSGYSAFNILGLVDAVDLKASRYDVLVPGDGDALPPLLDFEELVFARSKVGDLPLFRLPQSPSQMFMSGWLRKQLVSRSPAGGWGISTFEVRVRQAV